MQNFDEFCNKHKESHVYTNVLVTNLLLLRKIPRGGIVEEAEHIDGKVGPFSKKFLLETTILQKNL